MRMRSLLVLLLASLFLLGCGQDQPPPVEPALAQTTSVLEAAHKPGAEAEVLGLSPGLRTAMTKTLTAALMEFEIQPDASMAALQEFFQEIETQQTKSLNAADGLPNFHP